MFARIISSQFKKPRGLIGILTSNIMIKGNRQHYELLIKDLPIQPDDTILEIGYGPGIGITLIAEQHPAGILHGVDFSRLMYKRASARNQQYIEGGKVTLFFGDFLYLKINTDFYDKIFCLNVIYFWNNLQQPFEKIRSLLKKGGQFHFYMAHRDYLTSRKSADEIFNKYSIEQVTEALKLAGFEKVEYYFARGYHISAIKATG